MKADPIRIKRYCTDFRNSLIHRYWTIDDVVLIENIKSGRHDFDRFIEEIEAYIAAL